MLKKLGLLLVIALGARAACLDGDEFTHSAWLDSDTRILMRWCMADEEIVTEVTGREVGWMSIGFSPSGSMKGADIWLMWHDASGQPQFVDAHAKSNSYPIPDERNDVQMLRATKNATHSVFVLRRLMRTCDNQDWRITTDTQRVIWAWHEEVPADKSSLAKHSQMNRGSRSMNLVVDQIPEDFAAKLERVPEVQSIDLRMNNTKVPSHHHTFYYCRAFVVPKRKRAYIVGFDTVFSSPQTKSFVHHWVLYKCPASVKKHADQTLPCFQQQGPDGEMLGEPENPMRECSASPILIWAYGGKGFNFPENQGLPVFDDDEDEHVFMLEMHYDNQDYVPDVVDSSGARIYFSEAPELEPLQQLVLYARVSPISMIIPPALRKYTVYARCPVACTKDMTSEGTTVFAGYLHTHLIGKRARVRHFREGKELPMIMRDEHYDFNYQQLSMLPKRVTILPGDELVLECEYDSQSRDHATVGGIDTLDEMCGAFLFGTSQMGDSAVAACIAEADMSGLLERLQISKTPDLLYDDVITDLEGNEVDIRNHLAKKVDWTKQLNYETLVEALQRASRDADQEIVCQLNKDMPMRNFTIHSSLPTIREPLIEIDECAASSKKPPVIGNRRMAAPWSRLWYALTGWQPSADVSQ